MNQKICTIITAVVFVISMFVAMPAEAQSGEKMMGVRAGYNTRNESAVGGIVFQYRFSEHFRLAPEIDYIFRKVGTDAFSFNGNAHFPFALGQGVNIYPLAGLNFTSWNTKLEYDEEGSNEDDVSTRSGKFGLNVGGGIEYYASTTLKISFEGKFCWVNKYDTGAFTIGIGYVF